MRYVIDMDSVVRFLVVDTKLVSILIEFCCNGLLPRRSSR